MTELFDFIKLVAIVIVAVWTGALIAGVFILWPMMKLVDWWVVW